jgi:hypothetical protein
MSRVLNTRSKHQRSVSAPILTPPPPYSLHPAPLAVQPSRAAILQVDVRLLTPEGAEHWILAACKEEEVAPHMAVSAAVLWRRRGLPGKAVAESSLKKITEVVGDYVVAMVMVLMWRKWEVSLLLPLSTPSSFLLSPLLTSVCECGLVAITVRALTNCYAGSGGRQNVGWRWRG